MHYQQGKNRNQVFMISLDEMVPEDAFVPVIDLFVDAMRIEQYGFKNAHLNSTGNIPYNPFDLFKLLLYGYCNQLRSANKLQNATRINVEVMWLLKGLRPSSARTINYFRSLNGDAIDKTHKAFVRLCKKWHLIDGHTLAVDGTKIRA